MAKNLKAITDKELSILNELYTIESTNDYIIVKSNSEKYKRKTLHDIGPFSLLTPIRRITFSNQAIELWITEFEPEFTLLDVQAAINKLIVTYQEPSYINIKKELEKMKTE